jgi:hypothetical protein
MYYIYFMLNRRIVIQAQEWKMALQICIFKSAKQSGFQVTVLTFQFAEQCN